MKLWPFYLFPLTTVFCPTLTSTHWDTHLVVLLISSLKLEQQMHASTQTHNPCGWVISNLMLVKRHHFSVGCWMFVVMNDDLCNATVPLSILPPSHSVSFCVCRFLSSSISVFLPPSHRSFLCLPDHHNRMWFMVAHACKHTGRFV